MNRFAFLLGLGCALGVWNFTQRAGKKEGHAAVIMLVCALLGARAGYVWMHWLYFSRNEWEIFAFSSGGLDGPAACMGGALAWLLITLMQKKSFQKALDDSAALFIPVILSVWLGCWVEGVAYGPSLPQNSPLGRLNWQTSSPLHWPLPFLAAVCLTAMYYWLEKRYQNAQPGQRGGWVYLVGLLSILLISGLRSDNPAPLWYGVRIDIWESLGMLFVFLLAWLLPAGIERKGI
ncbi:MAG: prolipoprotein diacylglyceryl transferase [Anaerolineae bacterium]|nr:prolipoprotein diacylglyceryl transferase [Anaerolineae bacterium]